MRSRRRIIYSFGKLFFIYACFSVDFGNFIFVFPVRFRNFCLRIRCCVYFFFACFITDFLHFLYVNRFLYCQNMQFDCIPTVQQNYLFYTVSSIFRNDEKILNAVFADVRNSLFRLRKYRCCDIISYFRRIMRE